MEAIKIFEKSIMIIRAGNKIPVNIQCSLNTEKTTKTAMRSWRSLRKGKSTKCDGVLVSILKGWMPLSNVCLPNCLDFSTMNYYECGVIEQVNKHTSSIAKTQLIYTIRSGLAKCTCQIPEPPHGRYGCWGWLLR